MPRRWTTTGAVAGTCSSPDRAAGTGADQTTLAGTIRHIAASTGKRKRFISKHS
jgi:hypothetical protein